MGNMCDCSRDQYSDNHEQNTSSLNTTEANLVHHQKKQPSQANSSNANACEEGTSVPGDIVISNPIVSVSKGSKRTREEIKLANEEVGTEQYIVRRTTVDNDLIEIKFEFLSNFNEELELIGYLSKKVQEAYDSIKNKYPHLKISPAFINDGNVLKLTSKSKLGLLYSNILYQGDYLELVSDHADLNSEIKEKELLIGSDDLTQYVRLHDLYSKATFDFDYDELTSIQKKLEQNSMNFKLKAHILKEAKSLTDLDIKIRNMNLKEFDEYKSLKHFADKLALKRSVENKLEEVKEINENNIITLDPPKDAEELPQASTKPKLLQEEKQEQVEEITIEDSAAQGEPAINVDVDDVQHDINDSIVNNSFQDVESTSIILNEEENKENNKSLEIDQNAFESLK